jgi:hypothetical protein
MTINIQRVWTAHKENLEGTSGVRYRIELNSRPATVADVLDGWQYDTRFRAFFNSLLAYEPSEIRWETPCITTDTLTKQFELVVLESPGLARPPDPTPFAEHFCGVTSQVVSFGNLGGDAILVVPCPVADPICYASLGTFVQLAPVEQRDALWQSVGEAMAKRVGKKPVWLSTAGAGVPWLHVRLDDRPKYYRFGPYRATA